MSREIDRRDPNVNRATPLREAELHERAAVASDLLPGAHRVRIEGVDANTGNPSLIASNSAPAEAGLSAILAPGIGSAAWAISPLRAELVLGGPGELPR